MPCCNPDLALSSRGRSCIRMPAKAEASFELSLAYLVFGALGVNVRRAASHGAVKAPRSASMIPNVLVH